MQTRFPTTVLAWPGAFGEDLRHSADGGAALAAPLPDPAPSTTWCSSARLDVGWPTRRRSRYARPPRRGRSPTRRWTSGTAGRGRRAPQPRLDVRRCRRARDAVRGRRHAVHDDLDPLAQLVLAQRSRRARRPPRPRPRPPRLLTSVVLADPRPPCHPPGTDSPRQPPLKRCSDDDPHPSYRRTRLLAGAAGVALLLGACSSGSSKADDGKDAADGYDPAAQVTITWWTGQTTEAEATAEKLAAEYPRRTPTSRSTTSTGASTTDDLLTKLSAGFAGGSYPDISYAYGSWAGELGDQRQDPGPHQVRRGPGRSAGTEIPEAARTTATVDGKVIGVPALVDNLGADLQHEAVRRRPAWPTRPTSGRWDDFRAAAKKLTEPGARTSTARRTRSPAARTRPGTCGRCCGSAAGRSSTSEKPAFNSDAGVAALELLRAMAVDDKSMYLDQTDEKYGPLFNDGHVGMIMSGPWALYDLKEAEARLRRGVPARLQRRPPDRVRPRPVGAVRPRRRQPGRRLPRLHQVADQQGDRRAVEPRRSATCRCAPSEQDTAEFADVRQGVPRRRRSSSTTWPTPSRPGPTVAGYVEMSRYVGDGRSPRCCRAPPSRRKHSTRRPSKSAGRAGGLVTTDVRGYRPRRHAGRRRPRRSTPAAGGAGRDAHRLGVRRPGDAHRGRAVASSRPSGRSSSRARKWNGIAPAARRRLAQLRAAGAAIPTLAAAVRHTLLLTALFVPVVDPARHCSSRSR